MFEVYVQIRRRMNLGEFAPIADVVTQPWKGTYDLYDAYAFGQIYTGLQARKITITPIFLGVGPSADAQIEKNQMKLAALPSPFTALLRAGKDDDDSSFSWTEPIDIGETVIESNSVPLEVGYTHPLTTLWHLQHERWLARWPYGHERIWLLHAGEHWNRMPSLFKKTCG